MKTTRTLSAGDLFPELPRSNGKAAGTKAAKGKANGYEPPRLGKAVRLPVPDFSDPNRPPVCLEVDFPIASINALSNLEGNAGKPIYQMSKWWARRRSSIFRSLLIAAAVQAPEDRTQAAKRVWEHYYCNHQKAGHFRRLRVLDPFMGGGTTLVEGARLGFQMTGVDLNPVAWFITRNELACSDPEQVRAFFDHLEATVKPLVQPFYTTTCPRGHRGRWVDVETGKEVEVDPLRLPPDQRGRYRWEGPEVIYTFWAKHGPCQAPGCGHRTPIFKSPVIAEKRLAASYISTVCPSCGHRFDVELGETRMAPGAERVVLDNEPSFTETGQRFARLLSDYGKGSPVEKRRRVTELLSLVDREPGFRCPHCGGYAGERLKTTLEKHNRSTRAADYRKVDFGIQSRHAYMTLLVHPAWLRGSRGTRDGQELGGWAGASLESTWSWWQERLEALTLVEVRGRIKLAEEDVTSEDTAAEDQGAEEETSETEDAGGEGERKKYGIPREIVLRDGTRVQTRAGTVPKKSHFACGSCGRPQDVLEAVKPTGRTPPVVVCALQCHCPECDAQGYNYNGRYFKAPDLADIDRLARAESEWAGRKERDLKAYWPREELFQSYMTHKLNGGVPNWGYTHWWKMFNPRQLLVHTTFLQCLLDTSNENWPLDVKEQALGAFQQYLRNQNTFCFWDRDYDKLVPMMSNANYHPKALVIENCVFPQLGRGNWQSCVATVLEGLRWAAGPWEAVVLPSSDGARSLHAGTGDAIPPSACSVHCGSSTDLSVVGEPLFDLVITDPPFGNNLFYADLADFFYVWLRIPLLTLYDGLPERECFVPRRTPHALEAIQNSVEHPDDREDWEKDPYIRQDQLPTIWELAGDTNLKEKDHNPLYRPEPASDFYRQTLTACWAEAARLLKPGGLMVFTFHHSADAPWVDVLQALFDAGYILVATYPIRSDETKGAGGAFGSKKIEYDIIHVCRKRLETPAPVGWAKMRRWVKEEAGRLKDLLELSHGKDLSDADLLVILRGKSLEFYSRHYGQVYTGEGQLLGVRDAMLGIEQLLDDLLHGGSGNGKQRPPEEAEPASRLFLRVFGGRGSMARDELHKTLRGTGIAQGDLEGRGWLEVAGTTARVVPITERFAHFTTPGRNRRILKSDLDQAHFLIGAAMPGSGIEVTEELSRGSLRLKRSVDAILRWYAETDQNEEVRKAAALAGQLVGRWRTQVAKAPEAIQMTYFDRLEAEDG